MVLPGLQYKCTNVQNKGTTLPGNIIDKLHNWKSLRYSVIGYLWLYTNYTIHCFGIGIHIICKKYIYT